MPAGEGFPNARRNVAKEPLLIPLYRHRYLPAEPHAAGNPVLSVYQTDIIYYGSDLRSWLASEFGGLPHADAIAAPIRRIRFWSDVIDAACAWYRLSVAITDTTPQMAAIQLQRYREMGASGRARIAADLSDAVRETTMAGIRRRHPELSEREVIDAFLFLVYGHVRKP